MQHFDSNLGKELPERAYGQDCRLWIPGEGLHTKVLHETLWDEFVIAHSLGWIGKAIVLRNHWILWTCSIGFELMEQTFQHWLANFNECWWDSWLLDVAICNWGGLIVGMMAVKYFGSKKYNWQGTQRETGCCSLGKIVHSSNCDAQPVVPGSACVCDPVNLVGIGCLVLPVLSPS